MQLFERLQCPSQPFDDKVRDMRVNRRTPIRYRRQQRRDAPTITLPAVELHQGPHIVAALFFDLGDDVVGDILFEIRQGDREPSDTAGTTATRHHVCMREPLPHFEQALRLGAGVVARVVLHITHQLEWDRTQGQHGTGS